MCFVNHMCISDSHNAVPNSVFNKNYWYSVCQLVNGRNITNSIYASTSLVSTWDACRISFPNNVYKEKLQVGASNCLSEACTELATSYQNHIVENFESRMIKYLKYKLQHKFMVSVNLAIDVFILLMFALHLIVNGL